MQNAILYRSWLEQRGMNGFKHMPDDRGIFRVSSTLYILPYLRACTTTDPGIIELPPQYPGRWIPLLIEEKRSTKRTAGFEAAPERLNVPDKRWQRFFRADQVLTWLHSMFHEGDSRRQMRFEANLEEFLVYKWLYPLENHQLDRLPLFDRCVQAIHISAVERDGFPFRFTRQTDHFADEFRRNTAGLDPVHTPESERAALTQFLCLDSLISDDGSIHASGCKVDRSETVDWGPVTNWIPNQVHNAPRRLMLGASLVNHAVPLLNSDTPPGWSCRSWVPPGRVLRAAFLTAEGHNHEDAIIISQSASRKLTSRILHHCFVTIPWLVSQWESVEVGKNVTAGESLTTGMIDLFALGHDEEAMPIQAVQGLLPVSLKGGHAPCDGQIIDRIEQEDSLGERRVIHFTIEESSPVRVGDKLATWHGIKGVVSEVRPDERMPKLTTSQEPAEIVFSPIGIARRGAMGQFHEASVNPYERNARRAGQIFVMREPQNAASACRVFGRSSDCDLGQRYGEMEFWALMAHGADEIARELLSRARAVSPWIGAESVDQCEDLGLTLSRALNHFLGVLNFSVHGSVLSAPSPSSGYLTIHPRDDALKLDANSGAKLESQLDRLDDHRAYKRDGKGISAAIMLDPPVVTALPTKGHSFRSEIQLPQLFLFCAVDDVDHIRARRALTRAAAGLVHTSRLLADMHSRTPYDQRLEKYRKRAEAYINTIDRWPLASWHIIAPYVDSCVPNSHVPAPYQIAEAVDVPASCRTHKAIEAWLKTQEPNASGEATIISIRLPIAPLVEIDRVRRRWGLVLHCIHVVPPWLRPSFGDHPHPLTRLYRNLLRKEFVHRRLDQSEKRRRLAASRRRYAIRCVERTLDRDKGVGVFIKREILGRRLTRSARAVIVPDPALRIDQVRIPKTVAQQLFQGLAAQSTRLVLVNRNPTLHRRGLLAMQPVIDEEDRLVFGLPLAVLQAMAADFDGDTATVVALESEAALTQADRLLRPIRQSLRIDRFRSGTPGFPLGKELAIPQEQWQSIQAATDDEWAEEYRALIHRVIDRVDNEEQSGWLSPLFQEALEEHKGHWLGLSARDWRQRADEEMNVIYKGVAKKGQHGGVFRRHFYRQPFKSSESFTNAVDAMQTVTEKFVQTALTVKRGKGATMLDIDEFLREPRPHIETLKELDEAVDAEMICSQLAPAEAPTGLLAYLSSPTLRTLLTMLSLGPTETTAAVKRSTDPRLAWFL